VKDVRAGEAAGQAAQSVNGGHHLGVDFPGEHLVGNLRRGLAGHALSLKEGCLEAGFFHGARDGLAATVDDNGIDFDRFQEHDIPRDTVAHFRVGRIHEAAAVFDDESGAAEALDVGQGFQQRVGFGNKVLHVNARGLVDLSQVGGVEVFEIFLFQAGSDH